MGKAADLIGKLKSWDERVTNPLTLPAESRLPRFLALMLAHSGDSFVWAGLLALAWFFGEGQWKARVIVTFAGLVATELIVVLVKMSIRRPRPPGTSGAIYRRMDPYSFPSGHAARAVLLVILSFLMGPVEAFVAIVLWAPLMVLSRIAIGIHYVLDVLAGAVLGCAITGGLILAVNLALA